MVSSGTWRRRGFTSVWGLASEGAHLSRPDDDYAVIVLQQDSGVPASPSQAAHKVRIYSGKDKPPNAVAAVRHRDHWFWIDDGDWQTKRAVTAIMFFFTNRSGNEMRDSGLYVDLKPWQCHVFRVHAL